MQCVPGECKISGELLGKVLGSPMLERDGFTGESPAKMMVWSICPRRKGWRAGVVEAAHVSPVLVRQVEA